RALRRGASGEAGLPGAPDRGQRRTGLARDGAARRPRDAPARRAPRGHLVPFPRGPDRQALPARPGTRMHVPTRLPGLRVRARAVALNVAVLRVNMSLDRLNKQQIQLQAENTALASQLSSASSSLRIEQAARRLGLVPAPASDTSYLELGH